MVRQGCGKVYGGWEGGWKGGVAAARLGNGWNGWEKVRLMEKMERFLRL